MAIMIRKPTLLLFSFLLCLSAAGHAQDKNALEEARVLAREGKFQEALEKHIWFHDHILETDRSYYGVRLSFALADWIELGKKYPKALESLKGIRDSKTARLEGGEQDRVLFHDVESINGRLGQPQATVKLFKDLDAKQPEFAKKIYDLAEDNLVDAGEFVLARKYLGDPMVRFEKMSAGYRRGLEYSKDAKMGEDSKKAFERIFTTNVVRLITLLDQSGDPAKAREIQTKALAVLDNEAIRNAAKP